MKTYSLHELQTYIRRVIAANMTDSVWITAELSACGESRGHWYLELVEKNENTLKAQAQAVIWGNTYTQLLQRVGNALEQVLQSGVQVRMQVRVEYHERYGMKLVVQDIDPAFTFGTMALQRQATLAELQRTGALVANKQRVMPTVPQRIAVIASGKSAGYQDFLEQLQQNAYDYQFEITHFEAAVQGENAVAEIQQHLNTIDAQATHFDVVCILRGGGSRLDLVAFESLALALRAAQLQLPLLTGIGHEIDESILDLVAHTALKTPTAVADWLVARVLQFEMSLAQWANRLRKAGNQTLHEQTWQLGKIQQQMTWLLQQTAQQTKQQQLQVLQRLRFALKTNMAQQENALAHTAQKMELLRPQHAYKRGFSIATHQGKTLTAATHLPTGATIVTHFENDTAYSVLE